METKTWGRWLTNIIRALYIEDIVFFICDLFEPCFNREDITEARKIFSDRKKEVIDMLKNLADEESKITYKALIKYRTSGNRKLVFKVRRPQKEQYFMSVSERDILPPYEIFCRLWRLYGRYSGKSFKSGWNHRKILCI